MSETTKYANEHVDSSVTSYNDLSYYSLHSFYILLMLARDKMF